MPQMESPPLQDSDESPILLKMTLNNFSVEWLNIFA